MAAVLNSPSIIRPPSPPTPPPPSSLLPPAQQALHHSFSFPPAAAHRGSHIVRSPPWPRPKSLQIHHCLIHSDISSGGTSTAISGDNGLFLLFSEFDVDETELEALLQRHQPLAAAPVESLRRRLLSLQAVGISGAALHSTVLKRPDILTWAAAAVDPFLDLVRKDLKGLDPWKLQRFLLVADLDTLSAFPERIQFLLDQGIPPEKLGHVVSNVNMRKVFCEKTAEELDEVFAYLKSFGTGLGWILRRPQILNLDLETQLVPRVEYLIGLSGGDVGATTALIGKLPFILAYTVEHYQGHLDFWQSVGLCDEEVFKLALVYPNIFSVSKERKLAPRVEFLRECGLDSGDDVFRFLVKAPLFLSLSFEANLSKKLAFLVKIGYRHRTRELAAAMGAATRTSCENMQRVVGMFLGYGFSCEDVLAMSRKQPQVLQYNHASLEAKVEYLVGDMGREIGELLAFPAFLGYKLDDRIKRRYEAKKKSRGKGMSINKLLSVSAERFYWNEELSDQEHQVAEYCYCLDEVKS